MVYTECMLQNNRDVPAIEIQMARRNTRKQHGLGFFAKRD
jgi:hypothetical protein